MFLFTYTTVKFLLLETSQALKVITIKMLIIESFMDMIQKCPKYSR